MNISPFLSVSQSCDEALRWTKEQLKKADLHLVQTFDLHAARTALHDCPCPNHETADCDCQLVVLLVYGNAAEPVTLILHGSDEQTWVSLTGDPQQRADAKLINSIQQALEIKAPASISQAE